MKETLIALFRHGYTTYKQGNAACSIDEARDLCMPGLDDYQVGEQKAVEHVYQNAQLLLPHLRKSRTKIMSSPMGRSLHTAKCLYNYLSWEIPFGTLVPTNGIMPVEDLREVDNFSWQLYESLYNGGSVKVSGKEFVIDKKITNPRNLAEPDYFFHDEAHRLGLDSISMLPPDYLVATRSMETARSCFDRLLKTIRTAASHTEIRQWVFVTHAGLACLPIRAYTNHEVKDLERGSWLLLRATPDSANVIAANGVSSRAPSPNLYTYPLP